MPLEGCLLEEPAMRRIFVYSLVGLFGLLCGVGIGLKVSEKDPWEVIRRYRKWREDPQSYKPAGPPGLYVAEEPEDIRPSLAALVAKGELIHLDLVFPNVPRSSEVTMYWLQQCRTSGRRPGASSTATTPWTRMYTDSRGRTIRHDPRMFRHDPTALRQAQGRHRRHGAGH